jgi:membrane associated rhomboid family serine protease
MDSSPGHLRLPVTALLVASTCVAYGAQVASDLGGLETLVRLGGLQPERVASHAEYFRLVLPLFLHHDLLHLGLNLVALVQLAALVEGFFGSRRLLVTYVWTGVAGLLASAFLSAVPYVVTIGASGAVLGLAGLLMGVMWFGSEPIRGELADLLGRRLLWSVLATFAFGVGLWFVSDVVDNWAHAGGFLTGVAFSFVWSDAEPDEDEEGEVEEAPPDEPVWRTTAALLTGLVTVGAVGWMVVSGADALTTLPLDTARVYAARVSQQPGAWGNASLLFQLVERSTEAGAEEEGLEAFARGVRALDHPWPLASLADDLDRAARAGRSHDRAILLVGERLLEVSPTDPAALNLLAWDLVIVREEALRDPARAEALATRALGAVEDPDGEEGRTMTAQVLDTRAEARFQLRRFDEALADQERATELARELGIEQLPEFESRLSKIRRSVGRG